MSEKKENGCELKKIEEEKVDKKSNEATEETNTKAHAELKPLSKEEEKVAALGGALLKKCTRKLKREKGEYPGVKRLVFPDSLPTLEDWINLISDMIDFRMKSLKK